MAKSAQATAAPLAPPSAPLAFTFGDLLCSARHAYPQFRRQERLEVHLEWPNRKVLALEHGRLRPTAEDLAQLTAALPILKLLLERVRPPQRAIETAARL